MTPFPVFSIVIPTFNSAEHICKCIGSITKQEYEKYEIIVIDGASSDETVQIVKSFENCNIRLFSQKDNGIYDAMNKGIARAKGQWLYFIGCDDSLYDTNVLKDVSNQLRDDIDVLYGDVFFTKSKKRYDGKFDRSMLMKRNICHQSIFYNRSVFEKFGLFNTRYTLLADYEFNIRWFNDVKVRRRYIERIIANYDDGGSSFALNDANFSTDKEMIYSRSFPYLLRTFMKYKSVVKSLIR